MKSKLLVCFFLFISLFVKAQTPQFYNTFTSVESNNYPLSSATFTKAQWIFPPNSFNVGGTGFGSAAYIGNISKIFFKLGNAVNPSANYSNFTISLSQNVGTTTSFGTGIGGSAFNFVSGMTQSFFQASGFQMTGAVINSWYGFNLSTSFPYNPAFSLVVELKVTGGAGNRISLTTSPDPQRLYGNAASSVGTNAPGRPNFGINMISTPLPAVVSDFTGVKENLIDKLTWNTNSEINNAFFNLQHSTDGINFVTIDKINSKAPNGNSNTNLEYSAINIKPNTGRNYYRLEQVNIDGGSSFDIKIVELIRNSTNTIKLFPNPAKNEVNVEMNISNASNVVIKICDINGRVVKQIKTVGIIGLNTIPISINEIANGMYTIQVLQNDKLTFVDKFKKE